MSKSLRIRLKECLGARLERMGYKEVSTFIFRRTVGECSYLILVSSRVEYGSLKFTCNLGLQFEEIQRLIDGDFDKSEPLIVCPIHFLDPSRDYYEWEFTNEAELEVSADKFVEKFIAVGQPFFERFGTLAAVIQELRTNLDSKSFIVAQHERTAILASFEILSGNRKAAEELFMEAFHDPINRHPGKKQRLEELRDRILQHGLQ